METKRIRTWSGFIKALREVQNTYEIYRRELSDGQKYEQRIRLLFRGQASHKWELKTTLERKSDRPLHVLEYLWLAKKCAHEIESFTGSRWNIPEYPELETTLNDKQDAFKVVLPAYDYLVYLRHHGFPSPLLDWTESPFIAAYFAYHSATVENPAVYCYIEKPRRMKGGTGGDPMISLKGPYVTTHKRHFAQKAWYTIATKWSYEEQKHYFCPHDAIFDRGATVQDLLFKFVLPISERRKVLAHLNDYNINHFTLFQSEDSLVTALATKEFDLQEIQIP